MTHKAPADSGAKLCIVLACTSQTLLKFVLFSVCSQCKMHGYEEHKGDKFLLLDCKYME